MNHNKLIETIEKIGAIRNKELIILDSNYKITYKYKSKTKLDISLNFQIEDNIIRVVDWSFIKIGFLNEDFDILGIKGNESEVNLILSIIKDLIEEEKRKFTKEDIIMGLIKNELDYNSSFNLIDMQLENKSKKYVAIIEHDRVYYDEICEIALENLSAIMIDITPEKQLMIIKDDKDEEILSRVELLFDMIKQELLYEPYIAIGTEFSDYKNVRESYKNSQKTLNILKNYTLSKKIALYSKLIVPLLIDSSNLNTSDIDFDRFTQNAEIMMKDDELINTALLFFENNLNITDTANKLFIHRNTLIYRLNKIEKLTGYDLRKFDDSMSYYLIMNIYNKMK